jgi:multidrug transporter EmrE-like cation transporter
MIDPNSKKLWRRKPGARQDGLKHKILLFFSIVTGSCGQLLLKYGVKSLGGVSFSAGAAAELFRVFTCPSIIIGLVFMVLSMLLWLTVISKLELSFAYPFASLSYAMILIIAWLVFSERVGPVRIAGILCITAGVILISRTEKKTADN